MKSYRVPRSARCQALALYRQIEVPLNAAPGRSSPLPGLAPGVYYPALLAHSVTTVTQIKRKSCRNDATETGVRSRIHGSLGAQELLAPSLPVATRPGHIVRSISADLRVDEYVGKEAKFLPHRGLATTKPTILTL